jgi:hypothetical protein
MPQDEDFFGDVVLTGFDDIMVRDGDNLSGGEQDSSDDSDFFGHCGDELDEIMRDEGSEEDNLPFGPGAAHMSFDAPVIASVVTEDDETAAARNEIASLPQNQFGLMFKQVAPTVGDNLKEVGSDGRYIERDGNTNPNTRTCSNILRLGMLKHPPRPESVQGKCNYNNAVALCQKTAESVMQTTVRQIWTTLRETGFTPCQTRHALLSKTGDETEFPIRFSPAENKAWLTWQLVRINKERYLSPKDIALIADAMEANHVGIAHVLSQHVRLRFGPLDTEPGAYDVTTPASSVQRSSASNIRVAEETLPFEEVSFK